MTHTSQHSHELALMAVTKWTETNLSLVSRSGALANAESFATEIAKVYKAALLELGTPKIHIFLKRLTHILERLMRICMV